MTQTLFLGVDGGATACRARIVDADGRRLGEGRGGRANTRLGIERAFAAVIAATEQALDAAGLTRGQIAGLHAGLGLAGLSLAADVAAVEAHPHPFASMSVNTDAYAACLGAHGGADGGIFIFGTGSAGCAIVGGETVTVGGWGFDLSDDGSGARVGLAALRLALLGQEGVIPQTALGRTLLARFDDSPEQAVLWAASAEPADFGALAPLVAEQAAGGDAMATTVMREAGAGAGRLIATLRDKGAARIALVGGFADEIEPWLADEVRACLVAPQGDAMDGALLMARRARATAA